MYRLTSDITIADFSFTYITDVEVNSSIDNLTDTCKITIPRLLKWRGKEVSKLIKRGDQVTVNIGYAGENNEVFKGYVRTIGTGTPLILECENEMFRLKKVEVANEHYPSLQLKKFIDQYLPKDYNTDITDMNLGEVRISDMPSLAKVLEYFHSTYGIQFYFIGNIFYANMPGTLLLKSDKLNTHILKFGVNIISDSLNYQLAEDINLIIQAKCVLADNKKIEWREPKGAKDGEIKTYFCWWGKTEADLIKFAKDKLATEKIDRLNGKLTIMGLPYIKKSDFVKLYDDKNTERNNKLFIVKSVTTNFGTGGYKQTIEPGAQVKL